MPRLSVEEAPVQFPKNLASSFSLFLFYIILHVPMKWGYFDRLGWQLVLIPNENFFLSMHDYN